MDFKNFLSVFWAWNGDLDKATVVGQINDFADKGVGNLFIHARAGLKKEYMGEEWLDAFALAVDEAERRGVNIWIYDENGWPSGFGGGKVYERDDSFKERFLCSFTGTVDEFKQQNISPDKFLWVYENCDGEYRLLQEVPENTQKLYVFVYNKTNHFYVDITNAAATRCFIEVTHERYKERFGKHFGKTIKGVFTDEPHVSPEGFPCGEYVINAYEAEYGERVSDIAPYLFYDSPVSDTVRYRYFKTFSRLIKENYAEVCNEWCKANGLIFTGHYTCEEGLYDQASASGKLMPLYSDMGLIGVDALGNRLVPPTVYRQAMSVSWQFGNRELLSETFAGTGYDATFDELRRICAFQAANGVTAPCLSISMMSLVGNRKRDYPQFFSEQDPWWERVDGLFDSFKFLANEMRGDRKQNFLILHPMSGVWASYSKANPDRAMSISAAFRNLTENLLYYQADFDYADEESFPLASAEGGKVRLGNCVYDGVIVAQNINIEGTSLETLRRLAGEGVKICFYGDMPYMTDVRAEKPNIDFPFVYVVDRRDYLRKFLEMTVDYDVRICLPTERRLSDKFVTARRYNGGECRLFVLNPARDERASGRIVVKGKRRAYRVTECGRTELCGNYDEYENVSEFPFTAEGMEYFFVDFLVGEPLSICQKLRKSNAIEAECVDIGNNWFAVDSACYSVNGKDFCPVGNVTKKTAELYSEINGRGDIPVRIKYAFDVDGDVGNVFINLELADGSLTVNGNPVRAFEKSFYAGAVRADITPYIKMGANEVIIDKVFPAYHNELMGVDVFQSVTNVFSFPYYIESVFLEGQFDVRAENVRNTALCVRTADKFSLVSTTEKHVGDLTPQGGYFYKGIVIARYRYTKSGGGNFRLSFDRTHACAEIITVNGREYPVSASRTVDITDSLKDGENVIELKLYSSLRNIFGPHHHVYGKHYYTGPSVFEGYAEWQDFVMFPELTGETFVKDYSFTHLTVPTVVIEEI